MGDEENQTTSILTFLEEIWKFLLDKNQPVTFPDYWMKMLQNVKLSLEDQNSIHLPDYEKFEMGLSKIIKAWKMNWKRWSVGTFEQLYAKTSRLLAATYQMCFSSDLLKMVEDCVDGWIAADPHTEEDFSSSSTKETTSTSSTIAHGVTQAAGASGTKKR